MEINDEEITGRGCGTLQDRLSSYDEFISFT
jgi:hypothetical protein